MPDEDLKKVEYANVIAAARKEGWLRALMRAHFRPCDQDEARALIVWLQRNHRCPGLRLRYGSHRGRAGYKHSTREYRISLPIAPGTLFGGLRVGIVLHEAAHLIDHARVKRFSHDAGFREVFRKLLVSEWRHVVKDVSQIEIYERHRGPYALLLARRAPKGTATDRVQGPLTAEQAHEKARLLVSDPEGTVYQVHVFSENEGQYTGAFYERGGEYESWEVLKARQLEALDQEPEPTHAEERVELSDQRDEAALLSGREEPLREVDDPVVEREPAGAVPDARPVRDVPPQKPIAADAKKSKRGGRLELNPEKSEGWPKGKGADLVRDVLKDGAQLTVKELVERLTAPLAEIGVQFPASLISRLKQGGFLREAAGE